MVLDFRSVLSDGSKLLIVGLNVHSFIISLFNISKFCCTQLLELRILGWAYLTLGVLVAFPRDLDLEAINVLLSDICGLN
jgi:hypothetical protein